MPGAVFLNHFSALEDPRQAAKVVYPLPELLLLVLCATLCGAEDFVEITRWGKRKLDFLRRLLPFEHGIPSHDALNDVMKLCRHRFLLNVSLPGSKGCARRRSILSPLTARPHAVARPRAARLCIWSRPGRAANGWCSDRKQLPRGPMRSKRFASREPTICSRSRATGRCSLPKRASCSTPPRRGRSKATRPSTPTTAVSRPAVLTSAAIPAGSPRIGASPVSGISPTWRCWA